MGTNYTFHKLEKLSHKPTIEAIFKKKGESVFKPPVLLVYLNTELITPFPCQIFVSVGKRKFKRAVDRNRIKRQITEVYRLHKHRIYEKIDDETKYALAFLYLKDQHPNHSDLETNCIAAIDEFIKRIS